jgi:hypothetical protein
MRSRADSPNSPSSLTRPIRSGIFDVVAARSSENNLVAITTDDLSAFHNFALARISSGAAQNLHELVDIWEIEHPAPELHAQNVAAVQAAILDMQNGDTGRPAGQVLEELRAEFTRRRDS